MRKKIGILFLLVAILVLCYGIVKKLKGDSLSNTGKVKVVYNLGNDYNTLDPHLFTEMLAAQVDSTIYEGLLILDKDGKYIGGVAESFTENEDGTKFTFKIRKNAKWSDGSKITANDFVFAFKRVLDPKVAAQFSEMLFPIKNAEKYYNGEVDATELGIRAIDYNNLEIEMEYPTAYFKYILTLPISVPLQEKFYTSRGEKYAVKLEDFLFNGPYKIVNLGDDTIELEKNEYYWNKNNIKIPTITYTTTKDFKVVDTLIKNGEITMSRVEPYNLENYKKTNNINSFLNGRVWYLEYNLENKYLQNQKLRQAISLAIDREKYVKEIKKDGSVSAKSLISKIISGYKEKYRDEYPDKDYFPDNDVALAQKLYKEALSELGVDSLRLRLLAGNSDPEVLEVQFIQEELRIKLGLETDVETVPFKERLTKTRSDDYDLTLNTWSPKFDDSLSYLERWINKKNENVWSKGRYNELVSKIYRMPSSEERDKTINEAERILVDELPIAPIYFSIENHYIDSHIKGVIRRPVTGIAEFRWAYVD